jgi:DNA-binding protein H-NS
MVLSMGQTISGPANFRSQESFCIIKEGETMANKSVSLDGLSVSDLTALQVQIEEQIKARHAEEKQEIKKRILALLDEYGFTLGDIFPSAKGQTATAGAVKKTARIRYSDGQNTWAGRGRMPLWVKTFIQSGGKLDSLDVLK